MADLRGDLDPSGTICTIPGLDLYSMHADPAQYIITADTGCTSYDVDPSGKICTI